MSSIDKYVEGEARSCNPHVRVVNSGGMIKGYIGGNLVFSIADRYGYLSDSERSTIRNSIHEYEAEEQERIRREQIRIENERIAARNALKSAVVATKNNIRESYTNAQRLSMETAASLSVASDLDSLKKYNISSYIERAQTLEKKLKSCTEKLDSEYRAKVQEIESFERSIRDDSNRQTYIQQQDSLKRIHINFTSVEFPVSEIEQLKLEIEKLKEAISQIENIEKELKKINQDGLIGSIAASALKEIKEFNISSLDDVNKLLLRVQEHLAEIRNLKFQQQSKERSDQIALLNGILKTCAQLREYLISQPYESTNNRSEIVETANRVLGIYSELDTADYTTCSKEKIKEAYELVQEVLVGAASDEQTLEHLRRMLEEGFIYKRDDQLQADNYADYLKKYNELIERGVALEEIEAFDPANYEEQKKRLNAQLLGLDVQEGVNRTRTSFMMAWKVMEDMGYRLLYHNMGGEGSDALACEGIFVRPGCEGVVWQIVASDCNISRKIIGVERTTGMSTSIKRIREVAEIAEHDGEVQEFFERYAEEGGGQLEVTTDVYTDSPDCEQAIQANGCFKLTEEGEQCMDKLVQTEDASERKKWSTRLGAGQVQTRADTSGAPRSIREEESRRADARIAAQRAKK